MSRRWSKATFVLLLWGLTRWVCAAETPVTGTARNVFVAVGSDSLSMWALDHDRWPLEISAVAVLGGGVAVLTAQDVAVYRSLRDGKASWLDDSMPKVNLLGEGWIDASFAALAWAGGRGRFKEVSAAALESQGMVAIWSLAFKQVFSSNRPSADDTEHRFFDPSVTAKGFPSGHTMSAFALAEVYGAEYGRWWTYPVAGAVAYARVYTGQHWPSDVVAGGLLGIWIGHTVVRQSASKGSPTLFFSVAESPSGRTKMVVAGSRF
jgi:membrane-associated phospholipid phosphatase